MQPLIPVGDDHAAGEIEAALGQELQRLRKRTGMSLRAFAQAVGFSASFISQVENGVASPSIASLGKMAAALNVTIPELFIASHTHETVVVRAASRPGFRSAWSKARIDSLIAPGRSARLEALLVTLEAGGSSGKNASTVEVDQFTMALDSAVVLECAGDEIRLEPGDAALIRARTPHRWWNDGSATAQILIVSSRR